MERQLYFFEYVYRDAEDVLKALDAGKSAIFQAATDSAVASTETFRSKLHFDVAGFDIGRQVRIELGQPEDKPYATVIPIRWHAASQAALFPSMEGELQIVPLSHEADHPLTQIGILGHYRPPFGVFGAVGNAILGHHIAEAGVRNFVSELAARLK